MKTKFDLKKEKRITFPYKFHKTKEINLKLVYQITYKHDHTIFEPINCNSEQDIIISALDVFDKIWPKSHSDFQIYLIGVHHQISQRTQLKVKPVLLCTFEDISVIDSYALTRESNLSEFHSDFANSLIMRDAMSHSPIRYKNTFPKLIGSDTRWMYSNDPFPKNLDINLHESWSHQLAVKIEKFPLKQINDLKQTIQ